MFADPARDSPAALCPKRTSEAGRGPQVAGPQLKPKDVTRTGWEWVAAFEPKGEKKNPGRSEGLSCVALSGKRGPRPLGPKFRARGERNVHFQLTPSSTEGKKSSGLGVRKSKQQESCEKHPEEMPRTRFKENVSVFVEVGG